jgi:hypothetical protein
VVNVKNIILISLGIFIAISLNACSGAGDSSSISNQNNGFSVTSISPTPHSVIPVNQIFTFGFNNNLDSSSTNGVVLYNTKTESNEAINCQLTGDTSMQCTPVNSLAFGTEYNVILTSNIKNKAQNPLNQHALKYNTFSLPTVDSASPESGNVSLNSITYTYIFSESMNLDTLNSNKTPDNVIFTDQTAGVNVPISCQNTDNVTMVCTANLSFLTLNHNYLLSLSQKIKSHNNISILPTSYSYSATNYTQPAIVSASPESGNIGFSNLTYTYVFNESMSANTLNSSTTPNNVTFTDQVTGNKLPISCIGQSDNKTMICTITESSLSADHTYKINVTSKIYSMDNVSLIPTIFTYSLKNYSYNWSVIYNLPTTTAESIYNIQAVNNDVYACAQNGSTVYAIQYKDGAVNGKSTNFLGQCQTYSNSGFYMSSNYSPNQTFKKFNFNDNTLTTIDNGTGIFSINSATQNNGVIFYLTNPMTGVPNDYIKVYDGTNVSSIGLPREYPLYIRYYNGSIIATTTAGIYSSQNGIVNNITYNLPSGMHPLVDGNDLYMSTSYPNSLLYKLNGNIWQQITGTENILPQQIRAQSIYGFAAGNKVVKYSLIDGTTKDITPSMLANDRIDSLTIADNGNIYLAAGQKIYQGTIQ